MNNEDIKLLLVDLSARLTYGVKIQKINEPESAYRLYSIDTDSGKLKFVTFEGSSLSIGDGGYLVRAGKLRFKPYLRPMSSMTIEEFKEWLGYCKADYDCEFKPEPTFNFESCHLSINWLNQHHFDYRGLIEKGFALEAPEGMYMKGE